jgi:hypothetical protein
MNTTKMETEKEMVGLNKETLTSMEPTVMVVNPIVSRTLNFSR